MANPLNCIAIKPQKRANDGDAVQEEGKQIIGFTANEMQELKEAESPLFEARLNDVKCRSYLFKLKISEDTWQDEQRIRINVVRCSSLLLAHLPTSDLFLYSGCEGMALPSPPSHTLLHYRDCSAAALLSKYSKY